MMQIREKWILLSQLAVWLTGVIFLFVIAPPRLAINEPPSNTEKLTQFAVALLISAMTVLISGRSSANRRHLAIAGIILLFSGIFLLIMYNFMIDSWTCPYNDGRLVIGGHMTDLAKIYVSHHNGMSDCDVLFDFGNKNLRVWERADLILHKTIISCLFTCTVITFSSSTMLILTSIREKELPLDSPKPPNNPS